MKRYKRDIKLRSGTLFHLMVEDDDGEWVKYEDANELVEMLKELEFIHGESNYEYCPICEALRFAGHLTTCRLAALLKREGEK